jgi:hypothetical protein
MSSWTPEQWLALIGGLVGLAGTLIGTIVTAVLQIRGNAKTEAAKQISQDNNAKVTALVAQTNNIADAVPGASTAPTDHILNDPAMMARNRGA